MEFRFSKDEELLQWAAKDFADRELAGKDLQDFDQSLKNIQNKLGELGFLGIKLPEEYGGDPGSWVMLGILAEEIAKANVALAYYILISHEVCLSLASYGSAEAKEEWLPGLIKGEKFACICVTEHDAGSDLEAISSKANRVGDYYLISGTKKPVSFGMNADVALSFMKTNTKSDEGFTAMLVPLNLSGLTILPVNHMGMYLSTPASLTFDNAKIPVKYVVGQEGQGIQINSTTGLFSSTNKILSGLISLGMAQAALSMAFSYSKQRFAFGKPLVNFEAISSKLAEDATIIEAGRWLCYRALFLKDQKLPHAKEAAMSGWWCPRNAYQIIQNSLLLYGHAGYSDDHPFQQMLRDVVAFEMIPGTEQILKLIIGNETIGPVAVPDNVSECMAYHRMGG